MSISCKDLKFLERSTMTASGVDGVLYYDKQHRSGEVEQVTEIASGLMHQAAVEVIFASGIPAHRLEEALQRRQGLLDRLSGVTDPKQRKSMEEASRKLRL